MAGFWCKKKLENNQKKCPTDRSWPSWTARFRFSKNGLQKWARTLAKCLILMPAVRIRYNGNRIVPGCRLQVYSPERLFFLLGIFFSFFFGLICSFFSSFFFFVQKKHMKKSFKKRKKSKKKKLPKSLSNTTDVCGATGYGCRLLFFGCIHNLGIFKSAKINTCLHQKRPKKSFFGENCIKKHD